MMTRRCSHCSYYGHNSRTCPNRSGGAGPSSPGVRLFGVRLTDGSIIKKSASMGNLSSMHLSSSPDPGSPLSDHGHNSGNLLDGYLSDDPVHASCSTNQRGERKKGIPWTEEEHRMFLVGLQKLGKGDWRGISKSYVHSRTPTQVASHAQKYFIRQTNVARRKRRSSLFDMVTDTVADSLPLEHDLSSSSLARELDGRDASSPSLDLCLVPRCGEPMETVRQEVVEESDEVIDAEPNGNHQPSSAHTGDVRPEITASSCEYLPYIPGFFPAYIPIAYPFWPPNMLAHDDASVAPCPPIVKPVPVVPKEPVNVDQLVGLSHLSLRDAEAGRRLLEPSPLTLKLIGEPSRQSAFQVNSQANKSDMTSAGGSPIQAA